ncbi:unnamed protein product [Rhizoctonia solani]|uniref:Transmembrane protein n=1 Tax=Rhizoctonia solani TaxID=456999 RepID=A0A8H3D864_9AGAM|nr:unnamed protein product [Rhizoctonia solani]
MKLAPLLLAAPVVFGIVAADPRPTAGPNRRVLDRWRFARQDESTTAAGGGGGGAAASTTAAANTPTREATTASPTSATAETTSATPTSQAQPTTTSSPTSQQQQQTTPSSTPVARTTNTPASSTPQQSQPASNTPAQQPTSSQGQAAQTSQTPTSTSFSLSTPPPTTAVVSTTDQSGRVITSVVVLTQSAQSVAVLPTSSSTSSDEKKGTNQSTVIGLAVTGSIAGLLIILLIVWKLTGKRFSDLEDNDDDAIKWPELNKDSAAMTPIPARPSTRAAGAETDTLGTDFDRQSAAHSAADLSYAPYSDDPGYGARPAYYDPYGGAPGATKPYPSPPGSHDGDHKTWGAVPADAQYYEVPRGQSPGPNAIPRGMSPGPGMAYDPRATSPAPPNMAYADPVGRTGSPGPAAGTGGAYGYAPGGYAADPYGGRNSPGPNMAYAQPDMDPYGRRSPGPGMAYNGSVGRVASPGPNAGYR